MRSEHVEAHTKSLTDELPVCHLTGTGTATNQFYGENGLAADQHKSYDNSFQCQQFDDHMSLYIVCSGNAFSEFTKEKLVAEVLFGQLNDNALEDVKDILRLAFSSLERDYLTWIDECLTRQVQNMDQNRVSNDQATLQCFAEQNVLDGIHIALALIYNNKLYTCNVGKSRVILCKTDNSNVLRAVQMSADYEHDEAPSYACESLLSRLEIVGPIPLTESHRFLVLMSSGLCKTIQEIYSYEQQNVNRELIQAIVQQFRIQTSLTAVAQSVIDKMVSHHHDKYMQQMNAQIDCRSDVTLMIRNFNFPLPNQVRQSNVTFNPVYQEHLYTNSTLSISEESANNDTPCNTNNSSTTSSSRSEFSDKNLRISSYVDFSDYYKHIEAAERDGTLPPLLRLH